MSKGMNKNTDIQSASLVSKAGRDINWNQKINRQLSTALVKIKTTKETEKFLRDLLTPAEIKEFAGRLEAARLLTQDVQYSAISKSTGLSSATIARIAKWLYGPLGGYRLILNRLSNSTSKNHRTSSRQRKGLSLK